MKRYIKAADLAGIMSGSFEEQRRLTLEAIDRFEGLCTAPNGVVKPLPRPLSLVATFEAHAIVADAEGAFHRFTLDRAFDIRRETIDGKLTEVEHPMKVRQRDIYEGFHAMTESEAKRDHASLVEGAVWAVKEGKDPTSAIAGLIREGL